VKLAFKKERAFNRFLRVSKSSKKKKQASPRKWSWYVLMGITSPILSITLIVLSWVFFRQEVWNLTAQAPLVPVSSSVFELPVALLGNHRIILPDFLLPALLGMLSILAPFAAIILFVLTQRLFPQSRVIGFIASLVVLAVIYKFALPGTSPSPLFPWIVSALFLIPLSQETSSLKLWLYASLGVAISLLFPQFKTLILWAAFSLTLARVLHFLLVDRLRLKRSESQNLSFKLMQFIGGLALLAFIFLALQRIPLSMEHAGPSKLWYLSFSGGVLALILSTFQPWKTLHWMSLATFCQGALFFSNLDTAVIGAHVLLVVLLLIEIVHSMSKRFTLLASDGIRITFALLALTTSLFGCVWIAQKQEVQRDFDPEWLSVLSSLEPQIPQGSYVIGNGLLFLSQFRSSNFQFDPSLLLEPSTQKWVNYLKENNLNRIIIEIPHLQNFWSDWIRAGQKPEKINKSLLARILEVSKKETSNGSDSEDFKNYFEIESNEALEDLLVVRLAARP
jgi:hypothetical protein